MRTENCLNSLCDKKYAAITDIANVAAAAMTELRNIAAD